MDALPFDIIDSIFSHLSQSDSLTCMQVCRGWYERVPQYATDIWRDIFFSHRTNLKNQRMLRCLGPHVQRVVFNELLGVDLVEAMRILVDQSCTDIKILEFNACTITHEAMFLDTLSQLSNSRLFSLAFHEHRSSTDLVGVLASCPCLSHLSYATDDCCISKPSMSLRKEVVRSRVTHLHLHDRALQKNHCIDAVLGACPELEHLMLCDDLRNSPQGTSFDLDRLRHLCPGLLSFETNYHCGGVGGGFHAWQKRQQQEQEEEEQHVRQQQQQQQQQSQQHDATSVQQGLTYFSSVEQKGYGPGQMIPTLERNQQTLEVLSLRRDKQVCGIQGDWSPLRQGIVALPRLRALTLDDICMDGATIAALVTRAPALEELMLVGSSHRITDDVADALMGLTRLRCLHVCCTDEKRLVQGHEGFARFFGGAAAISSSRRLRVLGLMGRGLVTDAMLSHIAAIPTLEKLGLWYVTGDDLSDSGMAAFATSLQTTSLEMIQLSDIHQVTDRALFELVRRQSRLRHLDLSGCNGLTDRGLLRALRVGEANPGLQSVSVQDCAMVTDRAIVELVRVLGTDAVVYQKHGW